MNAGRAFAFLLASIMAIGRPASGQVVHCQVLRTSDSAYAGRCYRDTTTVALLVLRPSASAARGRWHGTQARVFGADGDSTKDVVDWTAFAPAFVDVGSTDSVFSWCWCRIVKSTLDTSGLRFDADLGRPVPAVTHDLDIVQLARGYLRDSTRWSRGDTRSRAIGYCPRTPATRTLYCALYEATTVVRGEGAYGGPAVGAVQAAIRIVSPRRYQHPLTDFNNDPLIGFDVLQRMFDEAVRRVRDAVGKPPGGA